MIDCALFLNLTDMYRDVWVILRSLAIYVYLSMAETHKLVNKDKLSINSFSICLHVNFKFYKGLTGIKA